MGRGKCEEQNEFIYYMIAQSVTDIKTKTRMETWRFDILNQDLCQDSGESHIKDFFKF